MDFVAADLSNPWVPWLVLGTAVLVTISTMVVQLRAFALGIRSWLGDARSPANASVLLAGSAGLGGIVGASTAVTVGGPGALVWMWIATALGMAMHYAEASSAAASEPGPAPYVAHRLGGLGKTVAALLSIGVVAFAVLGGAMLQTQQAGALLHGSLGTALPMAAGGLAVLALPFALSQKARGPLVRLAVPLALVVYTAIALGVAIEDPLLLQLAIGDAWNQAFGIGAAAGGTTGGVVAVALHHGVLRAVLAGEIGLGSATMASEAGADPHRSGAAAMLVPLLTVSTVSTMTALAVLGAPTDTEPVTEAQMVPLERHLSRGLRPSKQVGQTVVLPDDSGLEPNTYYAMLLRSNPRGHAFARLLRDENVVIFPDWEIARNTSQIIFRSRDPDLENDGAWDVRIDCTRETIDGKGGPNFVRLRPTDPDVELTKLIAFYELDSTPYVPVDDFEFPGRVAQATSPDEAIGEHLAMYEAEGEDRPFNPKFHEFFRGGFRGPYPRSDDPRPPWAFIANDGFDPDVGTVVRLEFHGDPRGDDLLRINRAGGVEAPPWDLMLEVREIVVRDDSLTGEDIVIPVAPRRDGFRVRMDTDDPKWQDFRKIASMDGKSGPYARIGTVPFDVEVHSDVRLDDEYAGRRSLVPLHDQIEPVGADGSLPYTPHPGELLAAGVAGPFVASEGAQAIANRVEQRFGGAGHMVLLVVIVVFAVSSIAVWSGYAARGAAFVLGEWARRPIQIAIVGAGAAGGALGFELLLAWVDTAIAIVVVPNVLALALVRPKAGARQASAPPPATPLPAKASSDDDDRAGKSGDDADA